MNCRIARDSANYRLTTQYALNKPVKRDRTSTVSPTNKGAPGGVPAHIGLVASKLELDLTAEFDHTVGRDTEAFGRGQGVTMHRLEQLDPDPADWFATPRRERSSPGRPKTRNPFANLKTTCHYFPL